MRALVAALALFASACAPATGDDTPGWARFAAPQRVTIAGYEGDAMEPFLSRDGGTLFFNNRNHPPERTDLHWATRQDDLTFRYRGLVEGANSTALDGVPTMSEGGLFCFVSTRAYMSDLSTVYCGPWRNGALQQATQQPEASVRVLGRLAFDVELDARAQRLIIADGLFRGGQAPAKADLRQARWDGSTFRLAPQDDALFAAINTPALEYAAALSADGRELAFTRLSGRPPFARLSIWIARRTADDAPFSAPVLIDAINGFVEAPTFTPASDALYFHKRERGRFVIWMTRRSAQR